MNEQTIFSDPEVEARYEQYKTLSFSAIVSLVLGFVSAPLVLVANQNAALLILPLIGVLVGAYSVLKIRRRREEFSGLRAAQIGLLSSALLLFGGAAWSSYSYATEVPEGYRRTSFSELQPSPQRPDLPFSEVAVELNESDVFIKGYVYPDGQIRDIEQFILIPDLGTCCFGGQPKLTDMIQVTLPEGTTVDYSYNRRNLAGKFRIAPTEAAKVGNVVFRLDADYLK